MRSIALALATTGLVFAAPLLAGTQAIESAVSSPSRSDANKALDESRQPAAVLEFAGIEEGAVVADFMAGGGYFTELIADVVGKNGKVYGLNPAGFHDPAAWEALTKAHPNALPIPTDPRAMVVAPGSVDTIFTHLVFHDLYWESEQFKFPRLDVEMMLGNWYAGVKPGGSVIVIDHVGPAGDPREVTANLHRIDPARIIADMAKAGFELEAQSDILRTSDDDHSKNVFDPAVRGKTDRVVMKFRKPSRAQ